MVIHEGFQAKFFTIFLINFFCSTVLKTTTQQNMARLLTMFTKKIRRMKMMIGQTTVTGPTMKRKKRRRYTSSELYTFTCFLTSLYKNVYDSINNGAGRNQQDFTLSNARRFYSSRERLPTAMLESYFIRL